MGINTSNNSGQLMQPGKITLDRIAFKALASETRVAILKTLDSRPMTVSEVSRKIDMNKATTYEHLGKLVDADLVKRREDKNKWVYYKLTWRGKNILHPETVKIALTLCAALVLIVVLFAAISQNSDEKINDKTPPTLTNLEVKVNNNQDIRSDSIGELEISLLVTDFGKGQSGINKESMKLWYAIEFGKNVTNDYSLQWYDIEIEIIGNYIEAKIKGIEWKEYGGKYLFIKFYVEDNVGVPATIISEEYIDPLEGPDFAIIEEEIFIYYSKEDLYYNDSANIIINATIHNFGSNNVTNVKVAFYERSPNLRQGGKKINEIGLIKYDIISFNSNESVKATINWHTEYINSTRIYVLVDPNNEIPELDENNNLQSKRLPDEIIKEEYPSNNMGPPAKDSADDSMSIIVGPICLLVIAFPLLIAFFIIYANWLSKKLK